MPVPYGYGPLLRALSRVSDDLATNAPLPPPESMTQEDAIAALEKARNVANVVSDWLISHPGVYWALRHVLTALAAMRVSWATDALTGLKAVPGALAEATIWLPRLTDFLKMTEAAPRGGPPITEADLSGGWKGPQAVDNPSGAIGGG